jgi:hypothetical protein
VPAQYEHMSGSGLVRALVEEVRTAKHVCRRDYETFRDIPRRIRRARPGFGASRLECEPSIVRPDPIPLPAAEAVASGASADCRGDTILCPTRC